MHLVWIKRWITTSQSFGVFIYGGMDWRNLASYPVEATRIRIMWNGRSSLLCTSWQRLYHYYRGFLSTLLRLGEEIIKCAVLSLVKAYWDSNLLLWLWFISIFTLTVHSNTSIQQREVSSRDSWATAEWLVTGLTPFVRAETIHSRAQSLT